MDSNSNSLNWLLELAPSSLGLQELASQVGSINYQKLTKWGDGLGLHIKLV